MTKREREAFEALRDALKHTHDALSNILEATVMGRKHAPFDHVHIPDFLRERGVASCSRSNSALAKAEALEREGRNDE